MSFEPSMENAGSGDFKPDRSIGRFACGSVAELVNHAKARLGGADHLASLAFAKGLTPVGERSASSLKSTQAVTSKPDSIACVHHCYSGVHLPVTHAGRVLLVAGTRQDAVDHCLIAHHIAESHGVSVLCLVDRALQGGLGCVELPTPLMAAASPKTKTAQYPISPNALNPSFATISKHLGRQVRPVKSIGPKTARQVLLGWGQIGSLARRIVESDCLSADIRLIQLHLVRPFPAKELKRQLVKSETLTLLIQIDHPLDAELCTMIEALVAGDQELPKINIIPLPEAVTSPQRLLNVIADSGLATTDKTFSIESRKPPFHLQIGATPAGKWTRKLLVESASAIVRALEPGIQRDLLSPTLNIEENPSYNSLAISDADQETGSFELLFCIANELVDAEPALTRLKSQGKLVLISGGPDVVDAWRTVSDKSRQLILEKKIEIWSICPSELPLQKTETIDSDHPFLVGSLFQALAGQLQMDGELENLLNEFELLGARATRRFDPVKLTVEPAGLEDPTTANQPNDYRPTPNNESQWRQTLRAFHLTGRGPRYECEPPLALPLRPTVSAKLTNEFPLAQHYPLIKRLDQADSDFQGWVSLFSILKNCLNDSGNPNAFDDAELERIVDKISDIPADTDSQSDSDARKEALAEIISEIGGHRNNDEMQQLPATAIASGHWIDFGPGTVAALYDSVAIERRQYVQSDFEKEIAGLVDRLQKLIHDWHLQDESDSSAESLAASLGEEGSAHVDFEKLAKNLPEVRGTKPFGNSEAGLIQETLEILTGYLESDSLRRLAYVVFSDKRAESGKVSAAKASFQVDHCFEYAAELVDGLLERMARVFRAARIARLVAEGCYDPKLHDEVFSRFGWQSCDEKELLHVPCVLVMESSGKIKADGSVGQLCRLLRSGRPIHVLIDQDVSDLDHQKLDGSLEDLAAVAMTCREAFVCQSTLARPDHLLSCFDEMAKSVRPSVAFVSSYPKYQASQWAWESLLVSHYSRMAPCFYDSPESGHQKTTHLDLTGNPGFRKSTVPDPDSPSPATAVDEIDAVTAAHAAALWPEFRQHFRIIPKQAWSNELQSIEDYLDEFELAPPSSLPYIRIEFHGQPGRAIITREMANVCRDRYLAWKRLQQLAGTDFGGHHEEHEVRTDLPLERAGESDVVRKKWQQEGAAIAVNRLVQALLDDNQSG